MENNDQSEGTVIENEPTVTQNEAAIKRPVGLAVIGHLVLAWSVISWVATYYLMDWMEVSSWGSGWAGAGHETISEIININFVPALICIAAGIAMIVLGIRNKMRFTWIEGLLAVLTGLLLVFVVGSAIALQHIS